MSIPMNCPKCGSDEVVYRPKLGKLTCDACTHTCSIAPAAAPEQDAHRAIIQACHDLGHAAHWLPAIENTWPAPIAHEYYRMRMMLLEERPNVANIVWQLKDFGEVLLKLPTLIMFRELYDAADDPARRRLAGEFLTKPLSMGDWASLSTTVAVAVLQAQIPMHTTRLAHLFRRKTSGTSASTALAQALAELVKWRNDEIGHGAHRLDYQEYVRDLTYWTERLNKALAEHQDAWNGYVLQTDSDVRGAAGRTLVGWQALGEHSQRHDELHLTTRACDLYLCGAGGFRLRLSPYIAYRDCPQCDRVDLFFFDAYKGRDRKSGFLDYYRAHKNSIPDHQSHGIAQEYRELQLDQVIQADGIDDGAVYGDHVQASVLKLLEECQLQAKTIAPDYLRDRLRDFVETSDRGIYWLKASGHIGKTTFVADLVAHPLYSAVRTCAFYIKREFHCSPAQFADALRNALSAIPVLNIAAGSKSVPELALDAMDPQQAFVEWLAQMRGASTYKGKLLICIDGLDELPMPGDEPGIADYLPTRFELPEGVFLLLASRPETDCPAWLARDLCARLRAAPTCSAFEVDPRHDAGYRALMRQYFYTRLRLKWEVDIDESLARSKGERVSRPARAATRALWIAFAADDKLKTYATFAMNKLKASDTAAMDAVLDVFQDYEDLFSTLLDKAAYTFLFLAYLVDTIETTGDWHAVTGSPEGEALLAHLIRHLNSAFADGNARLVPKSDDTIEDVRAPPNKNLDLAQRTLYLLAAAQEAAQRDNAYRSQPQPWRGLPLSAVAALLNEEATSAGGHDVVTNRLVFILYTLKPVLYSDKSDAASDARFSLGLDMATAIRTLYGKQVDHYHTRISLGFLETRAGRYADIPAGDLVAAYGRAMVMAHAMCSNDVDTQQRLQECLPDLVNNSWLRLAEAASGRNDTKDKLEWLDRIIEAQRIIFDQPSADFGFKIQLYGPYTMNRRERVIAIAELGGRNNMYRSTVQLLELRNEVLGWLRLLEEHQTGDYATFLEFCKIEQQLGYRYRYQAQTNVDLDNAVRYSENCRRRVASFVCAIASGGDALPPTELALLHLIYVKAGIEIAMCTRLRSEWLLRDRPVENDVPAEAAFDEALGSLESLVKAYLDESSTILDRLPPTETIGSEVIRLRSRINQERMRLEGPSQEQLVAGLDDLAALRTLPAEQRDATYAQDLAARLNDVGSIYIAQNDWEQASACFKEAITLLRNSSEQNSGRQFLLVHALCNEYAAMLQNAVSRPAAVAATEGVEDADSARNDLASLLPLSSEIQDRWRALESEVPMEDWTPVWSSVYDAFQKNDALFYGSIGKRIAGTPTPG